MRVLFKIMLGLLLFNTIFALLNPVFKTDGYADGVEYTDTDVEKYNLADMDIGDFLSMVFTNANALAVTGIISGIAVTAAIITKNYVYIGVGIFIGIITGMYSTFSNIISQLGSTVTGNDVYVTGLIYIISAAIGVLAMFNIVDMFAPSPSQ